MFNVSGRRRSLLIYNSYDDQISIKNKIVQLPSCKEDRVIMEKILDDLGFKQRIIHNRKLDKYVKHILKRANRDDLVFIHFSGHGEKGGIVTKGQVHLISSWLNPDKTLFLSTQLEELINQSLCENIIISSDCCYSGRFFNDYKSNKNIIFISSSSGISKSSAYSLNDENKSGSLSLLYKTISLEKNPTFEEFKQNVDGFIEKYKIGQNRIIVKMINK